jgi:hypothetical protein
LVISTVVRSLSAVGRISRSVDNRLSVRTPVVPVADRASGHGGGSRFHKPLAVELLVVDEMAYAAYP